MIRYRYYINSVVDRHRFDTDPEPNFHVDADPDQDSDPDWHQYDADSHADPTPSFTHYVKSELFLNFLAIPLPVYNVLSFSSVTNVS
jgi:hypothetical protein